MILKAPRLDTYWNLLNTGFKYILWQHSYVCFSVYLRYFDKVADKYLCHYETFSGHDSRQPLTPAGAACRGPQRVFTHYRAEVSTAVSVGKYA